MAMTLITNSADTDSTDLTSITFDSGIDSTYKLYIFKFIDINPATDNAMLAFQGNAAGASGYNETMTTTFFHTYHDESDSSYIFEYYAGNDQSLGTVFQNLVDDGIGNGADESCAGTLWLFNPSNTTYVKHFYSRLNSYNSDDRTSDVLVAGYFNTTSAIDDINFKMTAGNFDGTIKMYGVG